MYIFTIIETTYKRREEIKQLRVVKFCNIIMKSNFCKSGDIVSHK